MLFARRVERAKWKTCEKPLKHSIEADLYTKDGTLICFDLFALSRSLYRFPWSVSKAEQDGADLMVKPWFNLICVGWLPQEPVASRECLGL